MFKIQLKKRMKIEYLKEIKESKKRTMDNSSKEKLNAIFCLMAKLSKKTPGTKLLR